MNYQLLIESYSFGTSLSEQEIQLLSLELETQIMNINISTEFGCFKSADLKQPNSVEILIFII